MFPKQLLYVLLLSSLCVDVYGKCNDLSTQACRLMAANMPNLCQDRHTANVTCPRFCNMCPVTCYHCNIPLMDYRDCLTTKTCGIGEMCMLKELKSSVDGRNEYFMTCASKQECDGNGLAYLLGKRNVQPRNINVRCCSTDNCNTPLHHFTAPSPSNTPATDVYSLTPTPNTFMPKTTTQTSSVQTKTSSTKYTISTSTTQHSTPTARTHTTSTTQTSAPSPNTHPVTQHIVLPSPNFQPGCRRDIVFIMDASMRFYHDLSATGIRPFLASSYYASIRFGIQLIESVVAKLAIGPKENLVAMASFDDSVHSHWDLNTYIHDKSALLHEIYNLKKNISFKPHTDVEQAVQFVLNNILTAQHGDRSSFADDVVIITDTSSPFHSAVLKHALQIKSHDVIVVYVQNDGNSTGDVNTLATDSGHVIHVSNYGVVALAADRLVKLLCA